MGKIKHGIKNPQSSRGFQDSGECGGDTGNFCSLVWKFGAESWEKVPSTGSSWELGIENQLRLGFLVFFFLRIHEGNLQVLNNQCFMSIKSLSLGSRASVGD